MKIDIVDATEKHFKDLSEHMREVDVQEVFASSGAKPDEVCHASANMDAEAKAALANDKLVCLFGVVPVSAVPSIGVPWLLGTDLLNDIPHSLCRVTVKHLSEYMNRYDVLVNYVDARNKTTVKWLQWLGFSVELPESFGHLGLPFHRFEMRKQYNV